MALHADSVRAMFGLGVQAFCLHLCGALGSTSGLPACWAVLLQSGQARGDSIPVGTSAPVDHALQQRRCGKQLPV
jgi:hypothetical protein